MAPARRGGLVIALRDGIYRATEWGGALHLLIAADYDTATMRFNDGKCDPLGRFWAGTLNEAKNAASAALYSLDCRGGRPPDFKRMAGNATTGNGLAFASAPSRVYWADTADHLIRRWDWQPDANTLSGAPTEFHRFPAKPAGWHPGSPVRYAGRPDGATLDAQGHYWAAMFEGGQLLRLAPDGAPSLAVATPVQCPTMPCFGGDDLKTLFVTSARKGRPAAELAQRPASGQVVYARVAAGGVPVSFFDD
jgi:sugar lactone lactonase YvrE